MLYLFIILAHGCFATKSPLRIYGGDDAQPDEFPHVVRMERQTSFNFTNNIIVAYHEHFCTASALSPVWLISAAHCVSWIKQGTINEEPQTNSEKIVIRYGYVENSPWTKNSFSDVLFIVIHPFFTTNTVKNSQIVKNDIALLKISPMNIKSYIKLSAVDYQTFYGHEVVTAGYGITKKFDAGGRVETNTTLNLKKPLQVLKVLVSKCSPSESSLPVICLAPRCNAVATVCSGDSGGPVIHRSGIIGVLSLADMTHYCNLPTKNDKVETAAVVTVVSPYIEWIYSHVNY